MKEDEEKFVPVCMKESRLCLFFEGLLCSNSIPCKVLSYLVLVFLLLSVSYVLATMETVPTQQDGPSPFDGSFRRPNLTHSQLLSSYSDYSEAMSSWTQAGLRFAPDDQSTIKARAHILDTHPVSRGNVGDAACSKHPIAIYIKANTPLTVS